MSLRMHIRGHTTIFVHPDNCFRVPVNIPAFQRCGCVPLDENRGDVIAVVTTDMGPTLPAGTRDEFHLAKGQTTSTRYVTGG